MTIVEMSQWQKQEILDLRAFNEHRSRCSCDTRVPSESFTPCDECRIWQQASTELSKALLGASATTQTRCGSYAQAQVAEEIRRRHR